MGHTEPSAHSPKRCEQEPTFEPRWTEQRRGQRPNSRRTSLSATSPIVKHSRGQQRFQAQRLLVKTKCGAQQSRPAWSVRLSQVSLAHWADMVSCATTFPGATDVDAWKRLKESGPRSHWHTSGAFGVANNQVRSTSGMPWSRSIDEVLDRSLSGRQTFLDTDFHIQARAGTPKDLSRGTTTGARGDGGVRV